MNSKQAVRKKDDDDVSIETLITPEEKDVISEKSPSESSIHPCLRDIDISDSQMKLSNLSTSFPIPNDPGVGPAFQILAIQESFEEGGIYKFDEHVRSKGLKVIQSIAKMLQTEYIDLRYYGIDPRIVEIICCALQNNASVHTIDFTDNWLTKSACYYLGELLQKSNTINNLILAKCRIGSKGTEKLCDGISVSSSLITLNLNSCDLNEKGLEVLALAVGDNQSLEELFLANNNLNKACAEHLCYIIAHSKSIKWLDLSSNSLFDQQTWKGLANALLKNYILVGLNLSWNGIDSECVKYLTIILRRSQLEILDLRNNMLTKSDAEIISKPLSKNNALEELYLGSNPLGAEGAFILISSLTLTNSPDSSLRLLNLENVWADKNILPELESIENEKPWLQIELGGILRNYKLVGPDVQKILLRRAQYEAMAQKRKKRRRNFGHFVLSLNDRPIRIGQFRQLIRNFKLRLSKSLIKEIINAFPGPRKTVDQALIKAIYLKEFPDTKPPPVKPSIKKEEEKKEEIEKVELEKSKVKQIPKEKPEYFEEISYEIEEDIFNDWYEELKYY
ncbi:PREDICTED: ribonuclease inhibitor [Polistes dominula]|uniref:Ribonuclease inhibitor n=1 Tax=Polistes dominula TaxID=743375 RepID=A0ABM1I5U8_POLDO|nr:PREDICTED: ribonuclease inhibitor [Polistes dominula]